MFLYLPVFVSLDPEKHRRPGDDQLEAARLYLLT